MIFDLFAGADAHLASVDVDFARAVGGSALKALFGARRVNGLEHLINGNYDEAQLIDQLTCLGYNVANVLGGHNMQTATLYVENQRKAIAAALHDLLVQEALTYGLASAETAFVATRTEAGEPVAATVAVANALPTGWSASFALYAPASLPQGSVPTAMPMAALASPAPTGMMTRAATMPSGGAALGLLSGRAKMQSVREAAPASQLTIFQGDLALAYRQKMLFDSTQASEQFPAACTLTGLRLQTSDKAHVKWLTIDSQLILAIYVDDLATPRARVRLRDLLQHGDRPLNLQRRAGQVVRVVLEGAAATATFSAAQHATFTLSLYYQPC